MDQRKQRGDEKQLSSPQHMRDVNFPSPQLRVSSGLDEKARAAHRETKTDQGDQQVFSCVRALHRRSVFEGVRSENTVFPGHTCSDQYFRLEPPMNSRITEFVGTGLSSSTGVIEFNRLATRLARVYASSLRGSTWNSRAHCWNSSFNLAA